MRAKAVIRGAISLVLFVVFGLGALLLAPLMLILRRPNWCQPLVRLAWCPLIGLFILFRLIRVKSANLGGLRGAVIAMNHPSLIDVVVLSVILPRTLYVAKHALRSNPFVAAIVRHTSLPDDANLPCAAAPYLAKGWNVLIFPEGTRSPSEGGMRPFHRGAAQVVLRTGAPLAAVGLSVSRRILGKGQPPWEIGSGIVDYSLVADEPRIETVGADESLHAAACRVTDDLSRRIGRLMEQAKERI